MANNEVNLGLKPGEKMKVTSNLQWSKLNNAIIKTVIGITAPGRSLGKLVMLGFFNAEEGDFLAVWSIRISMNFQR